MDLWFDRAGLPITTEEWGRLHAIEDYVRIGSTDIGPYWVSTVWVGLDHRFIGDGPPIIFETMVFAKEQRDDPEDLGLREFDMVRYCTEEEAVAGHEAMCLLVRATTQEEPDMERERQKGSQM
jgi:hypothetical protein